MTFSWDLSVTTIQVMFHGTYIERIPQRYAMQSELREGRLNRWYADGVGAW
jgi:hypothetical protein